MSEQESKYKVWSVNTFQYKPLWVMGEFSDRQVALDRAAEICRDNGAEKEPKYERVMFYSDQNGYEQEAILCSDPKTLIGAIVEGLLIVPPTEDKRLDVVLLPLPEV